MSVIVIVLGLCKSIACTCNGTATSVAMNANVPRHALFVATAEEERPELASTIYDSVLEYMALVNKRMLSVSQRQYRGQEEAAESH